MASGRQKSVRAQAAPAAAASGFQAAVEQAKLRALYNFAYGLSHEINNPLANISARAETLLTGEQDPDRRKKLTTIVQQAFRAHEMIADLMLFARPPAPAPDTTDLGQLAATVLSELRPLADQQQTQLIQSGHARLVAVVDGVQIAVALKALVQNALEAVAQGGRVQVLVETHDAWQARRSPHHSNGHAQKSPPRAHHKKPLPTIQQPPQVYLSVIDDGPGISPEALPQIFDPFYSGREAGRGLGLGLPKAWRIADRHGGRIDVDRERQRGAALTIVLPKEPAGWTSLVKPKRPRRPR